MSIDRFRKALAGAVRKAEDKQWVYGTLGRKASDGSYVFDVKGRRNFVYVTVRNSAGAQTVVGARNDAAVEHAPNLAVKMRHEYGVYVIHSKTGRSDISVPPDYPDDGVPLHTHAHAALTLLDADDHIQYHTDARGDIRYFTKTEHIDVSAGAADAGKPVVLDAVGQIDDTMLPSITADPVEDQILDAATDDTLLDADWFGYVTGSTLVKTGWLNIKSLLNTYFATLFAPIAKGVTNGDSHNHDGGDGAQVAHSSLSGIGSNTHAAIDSALTTAAANDATAAAHIAATTAHGATGAVMGTTNTQSPQNKTFDSTNKGSFTAKNPPIDADSVVVVDSAAASVFKAVTFTNIKAFLKTYLDTLYVLVAGKAGGQTVAGGTDSGDDLILKSTSHATPGNVVLQPTGGQVLVGTDNQTAAGVDVGLALEREGNFNSLILICYRTSASGARNSFSAYAASGSKALPAPLTSGQTAFRLSSFAYDGSVFAQMGIVDFIADGGHSAGSTPGGIQLKTTPNGSTTPVTAVTIHQNQVVGVNIQNPGATHLGVQAGTSSNDAAAGGMLYSQPLSVGNTLGGEDDLLNYSLPADTLSANGMILDIWAVFTPVNNANAKTFRIRFGSTVLINNSHPTGGSGSPLIFHLMCMRTGATSQRWIIDNESSRSIITSAETLSGSIPIRFTGEGVATNDIVLNQVMIEWKDTNT